MKRTFTPRPWLTELRKQNGMAEPKDLADAVGVTDNYIRYLEKGTSRPGPELAIQIGEALGLSETESLVKFFGKSA